MATPDEIKAQTQSRFAQYAQGYIDSPNHAKGEDLERLIELAQPQPDWMMMDVATGAGHTALKFSRHVRHVVMADFTPDMLAVARTFVTGKGAANTSFVLTDAENLAFVPDSFDLVTCRIAPHHFPDVYKFAVSVERVLKPGGLFVLQDHVLPEDKRAGSYIDSFQRLRDPSHHRAYSESEWRGLFLDADFIIEHGEMASKTTPLVTWAERQGCDADTIERLQVMLAQAPQVVADWLSPACVGTKDATFVQGYMLIVGRKK